MSNVQIPINTDEQEQQKDRHLVLEGILTLPPEEQEKNSDLGVICIENLQIWH